MNTESVTTQASPANLAFEASHFSIEHLSTSPEGLEIRTRSVGRTAGAALELNDTQKDQLRRSMPGEMKFRGVGAVKEARTAWRTALTDGAPDDELADLQDAFFTAREKYINTGKKVSLRNIARNSENPDVIEADAAITDYLSYVLFAKPETTGTIGEMAQLTGVAMALTTSDGRLVLQHRATETFDYVAAKKKPGNGMYGDIPGVSVAGMADAHLTSPERQAGTPDEVTNESLENSILKEAGEELGIGPEHFSSRKIVGIARDHIKPHSEVLFLATTNLTSAELRHESKHSNRNKNLSEADLEEKYLDIEASPEAIRTLLTEVKAPLPPTHAAAYVAAGHAMVLERSGQAAAEAWLTDMEHAIAENYRTMDEIVEAFYWDHPEAIAIVPERMWAKKVLPERNTSGYDPSFTPEEQGLPNLEDELVRTGLIAETRQPLTKAHLFDVDGVLTHPSEKRVTDPALFDEVIARLEAGEYVALNTGRSTAWLETNFLAPLLERVKDPAILSQLFCVGEKGGTWATVDQSKRITHGKVASIALPDDLKSRVGDLVTEKYSDQMFYDQTKETMVSVEMVDGGNIEEFQQHQRAFFDDVRAILQELGLDSQYRIDPTTIATDVESPNVSKALGARRFVEYLKSQDVAYSSAQFDAYGDSPSDAAMTDELARLKLNTEFVFVGDPAKLTEQSPHYPVRIVSGYNDATLQHLRENN